MSVAVVAENVAKYYGSIPALKSASFRVEAGKVLAIIGPNGAGKTTLFKALTGEVLPDRGSVHFGDIDVTRLPAHQRAKLGVGRTFQVSRVFQDSTALDNVVVAIEARQRAAGDSPAKWYQFLPARAVVAEAEQALADMGLSSKRHVEARFLSHGDRKRLEMALTLALRPSILMLDEPTAGMSPSDRQSTVELLKHIQQTTGATMLLTEHDMEVVFGLADNVLVLNYGEKVAIGAPEDIRANKAVRELYLGEDVNHA